MDDELDLRPAPDRTRSRSRSGRRRTLVLIVLIGLGLALGWWLLGRGTRPKPAGRAAGGAPVAVSTGTVGPGTIDVTLTGLGAVTPLATITVVTQINGQLQELDFTEGQLVRKGQLLALIDPRPYEIALQSAEGTLAHDQGLLDQAISDSARYQTLSRQNSIAQQQAADQQFLIRQDQGQVLVDRAVIANDRLNLAYCHITSPVDGRVGIRLVDPGNYVQTTMTSGLFVVTQLQPISVLFTLPEDDVAAVQGAMGGGTLKVMAYDRADARLIATGTLATTDNQIDNTTGTVELRAVFPNADNALFPQQFVNAHLLLKTLAGIVVAPEAAIQHGAPGDFVYLLRPNHTVAVQAVHVGPSQDGRIQVLDGLKPGDVVAVDGLDRLRDGARITIAGAPGSRPGSHSGRPAAPAR